MESPTPAPRVTVRQLAERLKISHTTVSRALHDDPRITSTVREKVKEMARQMGYRPDPMLSALASYRLDKARGPIQAELAWINCWPQPENFRKFKEFDLYWRGATKEAERAGYRIEAFNCPAEFSPARLAQILRARNIRGLLLMPAWAGGSPDWGDFPWNEFSIVRFGYSLKAPAAHVVASDQLLDGMLAFENIWARGYRRIGMVMHQTAGTRVVRFSAGFLYGQLKVDPGLRLTPFPRGETYSAEEQSRFNDWLKKHKPDAILTDTRDLRQMLERAGYQVPRDIGLAALSILDGCADAGIDQHSEEVGAAGIQLLTSLIGHHQTGIPAIPREVLVAGRWVDGTSLPARVTP